IALRSTGQSSRRSIKPFSRSAAMVRPSPSKLAKTKATHDAPGAIAALLSTRKSKAKLKMTSTSRANKPIPIQVCLLRSSQRISFQRIASTCSRKVIAAPPGRPRARCQLLSRRFRFDRSDVLRLTSRCAHSTAARVQDGALSIGRHHHLDGALEERFLAARYLPHPARCLVRREEAGAARATGRAPGPDAAPGHVRARWCAHQRVLPAPLALVGRRRVLYSAERCTCARRRAGSPRRSIHHRDRADGPQSPPADAPAADRGQDRDRRYEPFPRLDWSERPKYAAGLSFPRH